MRCEFMPCKSHLVYKKKVFVEYTDFVWEGDVKISVVSMYLKIYQLSLPISIFLRSKAFLCYNLLTEHVSALGGKRTLLGQAFCFLALPQSNVFL